MSLTCVSSRVCVGAPSRASNSRAHSATRFAPQQLRSVRAFAPRTTLSRTACNDRGALTCKAENGAHVDPERFPPMFPFLKVEAIIRPWRLSYVTIVRDSHLPSLCVLMLFSLNRSESTSLKFPAKFGSESYYQCGNYHTCGLFGVCG
eukprot:6715929-Pyramimonas_sp.AAC.1